MAYWKIKIEEGIKMKRLAFCLLILFVMDLSAQDFAIKEPQLVTIFPAGDSESSFGYRYTRSGSGDSGGPTAFCFDSDGNLVVSDTVNKRISIFDQNWQPLKTIELDYSFGAYRMEIDTKGNFIGYYGKSGIKKIDAEGNTHLFLYVAGEEIADNIRSDGFYVIDNLVVAYNKYNGGLIGFKNLTPDYKENNKKPILNTQQVIRELEQSSYSSVQIEKKESSVPMQRSQSTSSVPRRVTSGDEYVILKDGELLSRDFNTIQQSGSTQSQVLKSTQLEAMSEDNGLISLFTKYKDIHDKIYYGKDNDGNEYWKFRAYMFVLDLSGVPIKAIELQRGLGRTTGFVLSGAGDIYYMHTTENGHYLYRYKRDW